MQVGPLVGDGGGGGVTAGWPASLTWAIKGSSARPPLLEMYVSPTIPTVGVVLGAEIETVRACWDQLHCIPDWAQFQPLYKLGFWRAGVKVSICLGRFLGYIPWLIKAAPFQPEAACLSSVSLPSPHGAVSGFTQRPPEFANRHSPNHVANEKRRPFSAASSQR